ncbi:hypothetical protein FRC04_006558 [Tulasnella sp. 424]|nr:hypothetical protein FRC04_006558 [Tulasnella sp. 424]
MQATHHQQHQHQLHSWQSSQAPAIHPALSTPPVVLAGGKRKLSDDFGSASNPRTSALDALRGKRQRRFRSAGSISDSDDDKDPFDSPRTPALDDETMEWTAESTSSSSTALTAAGLGPNQSLPPWRAPSPSQAIHRLELLREARPPVVTTYTSSFAQAPYSREPPPSKAVPMVLHTTDDEYVFTVELPGYNIDLRAMMDRSSNMLTLIAKRYRRFVPIEYQVERKPMQQPAAFHS